MSSPMDVDNPVIEFKTNGDIIVMLLADQLHDFFGSRGDQDQDEEGLAIKVDRDYMIRMVKDAWVGNSIISKDIFFDLNLSKETNFQQKAEQMIHKYNGLVDPKEGGFQNIDIKVTDVNVKYDLRDTTALLDIYLSKVKSQNDNNINIHVDAVKRNRLFKSYMNSDIVQDTTSVLSAVQRNSLNTKTNVYSTYVSGNLYDMANMDSMYKESIRTGKYLKNKSPIDETYKITDKSKNTITWTISKEEFWYDTILKYKDNYTYLIGNDKEYSKFIKKVFDYYNSDFSVSSPDVKHNLKSLLKIYNKKILEKASDGKVVTYFLKKKDGSSNFKPETSIKIEGKSEIKSPISGVNNFVKFLTSKIVEQKYRTFQLQCIKSSFQVIFNSEEEEEIKLRMFEPLTLKQIPDYARTINEKASITHLNINGLDLTSNILSLLPKLYEMGGPSVSNIYKTLNPKNKQFAGDNKDKLALLMCKTLGDLTVITSSFKEGTEYDIIFYGNNNKQEKMRNALLTFDITCANIARSLSIGRVPLRPYVILQTPGGDYEFKVDHEVAKLLTLSDHPRYEETAVAILAGMEQNRNYENMRYKCDMFRDKLANKIGNFNLPSCDDSVEQVYGILQPL